jgi:hypothetical protein
MMETEPTTKAFETAENVEILQAAFRWGLSPEEFASKLISRTQLSTGKLSRTDLAALLISPTSRCIAFYFQTHGKSLSSAIALAKEYMSMKSGSEHDIEAQPNADRSLEHFRWRIVSYHLLSSLLSQAKRTEVSEPVKDASTASAGIRVAISLLGRLLPECPPYEADVPGLLTATKLVLISYSAEPSSVLMVRFNVIDTFLF